MLVASPVSDRRAVAVRSLFGRLWPGVGLCLVLTLVAELLQMLEIRLSGHGWVETLVLAILVGTIVRMLWTPSARWWPGIDFSAKFLLELAVVLLGASVSTATILAIGPALLVGIAAVVLVAIAASFALGRLFGLPPRMAVLVACGNAICGNSAIAAIAPVIRADGDDVAAAIAFTAVLGVALVIGLPVFATVTGMSGLRFGAFAGLTVYAVPQVLAATAPAGATAVHMGTVVKLVRVLMLGPVCLVLALVAPRVAPDDATRHGTAGMRPDLRQLVPWFIIGFLAMLAARSAGLVPSLLIAPIGMAAKELTIVAMAALGLGVEVGAVARAGMRVIATVTASLAILAGLSLGLLRLAGVG